MAEQHQPESADAAGAGEKSSKGGGKTFLVTIIAVILAAVGAGAAAAYVFFPDVYALANREPGATEQVEEEEPAEPTEYGEFMELPGFVVNPAGTGGRGALMVNVGLEGSDAEVLDAITAKEVVIRDRILGKLSKLNRDQLSDISIRDSIKLDLREEINAVLEDGGLNRVYFTAWILQ